MALCVRYLLTIYKYVVAFSPIYNTTDELATTYGFLKIATLKLLLIQLVSVLFLLMMIIFSDAFTMMCQLWLSVVRPELEVEEPKED